MSFKRIPGLLLFVLALSLRVSAQTGARAQANQQDFETNNATALTTYLQLTLESPSATGNVEVKNASADSVIYLSASGNDSNDGLSWASAKLTPQAAIRAATYSGTRPGTVYVACGTYPGPTIWYQNLNVISFCRAPLGAICGSYLCGPNNNYSSTAAESIFQYATGFALTTASGNLLNIGLDGILFDFENAGGGLTLQNVAGFIWNDFGVIRCGNTDTDCLVLTAARAGFNTSFNTFRDFFINPNSAAKEYASCLTLKGTGSVLGPGVYDNFFYNYHCTGQINNGLDFELNSDSNFFYGVSIFQSLASAVHGSSALVFNRLTPGTDQDAGNGCLVSGFNLTGSFDNYISMGQTTGPTISAQTGSSGISVNVLGGTPQYTLESIPLTAGTKPQMASTGLNIARRFSNATATALTTSAFNFNGTNWGNGPVFNSVRGSDASYILTFTTGSGSPGANPTFNLNYVDGSWGTAPICDATRTDAASPASAYFQVSGTSSATTQTITFVGTPAASTQYKVTVQCRGSPN